MPVVVKRSPQYEPLYNPTPGTNLIICIGGRGGMKTYEVSKFIAFSATIKKKRCVILRDEKSLIRESILNEIWARYDTANSSGALDTECIKNETELKDRKTGKVLIYTKGFRASDNQKKANLKGPSDIDIAVVEEGEDIRDKTKYDTFVDGLRKEGCIVIIMLNTPDINHFLIRRFFNTTQVQDGYYRLSPKQIEGFTAIQTSFEDNPYLPAHIIDRYNGYGDPSHHLYDKHYYLTQIKGYASTGRQGQVFTKIKPISLKDYLALPHKESYGQDFGTASPAALCGAKFHQNTCWARLINYLPMDVLSLGKLYSQLRFTAQDRIVCDYAEPDTIKTLKNGFKNLSDEDYIKYPLISKGFFCVPCPSKDISARISVANGMTLYLVEESTEAWDEVNNYVYAQDKNKNYTDEPIDDYNHFLDAWMYLIMDQRGKNQDPTGSRKLY